jgi:hypothetical protein
MNGTETKHAVGYHVMLSLSAMACHRLLLRGRETVQMALGCYWNGYSFECSIAEAIRKHEQRHHGQLAAFFGEEHAAYFR